MKTILITGSEGFIGHHLVKRLDNHNIICIDKTLNGDIFDKDFLDNIFKNNNIDIVIHLAAQAGVRYSIDNPDIYIESNIIGFYNILEACRRYNVRKLIYASSSSVYGDNVEIPYREDMNTDSPKSLYAATKKCDEVLAYSYYSLYGINSVGLRFFTVYGPEGRKDMFYYKFIDKISKGEKIEVYNYGDCIRDFTYIDDVVECIIRVIDKIDGYRIYNIGSGKPIKMKEFIRILSNILDIDTSSYIEFTDKQKGDVDITFADNEKFYRDYGYKPITDIYKGLSKFVEWYESNIIHSH